MILMGLFRRPTVSCRAGEWTRVIFDFGKGMAETMEVELHCSEDTDVIAEYRETHYNWIFPKEPVTGEFSASCRFSRRWIDGIYSVYIRPSIDCVASIK